MSRVRVAPPSISFALAVTVSLKLWYIRNCDFFYG